MSDKTFLDTNILVYLYDTDAPEKQEKSRGVLEQASAQTDIESLTI
jgi:predicted nucleic acid-binding protein